MSRRSLITIAIMAGLLSTTGGCYLLCRVSPSLCPHKGVEIEQRKGYYFVTIDMTQGYTHHEIGYSYGKAVFQTDPLFLIKIGSYLTQIQLNYGFKLAEIRQRIENIKANLDPSYRDEIDGFIDSAYSLGADQDLPQLVNIRDLVYVFNLLPDIARDTRCSAMAVWGGKSAEGTTICHRNLDWFGGLLGELSGLQAIIKFVYPDKNVYMIGGLGHFGCISGVNGKTGVFGGILDSDIDGTTYYSTGCRSYNFDLRYALENFDTKDQMADYLKDPNKDYTYSHQIFLADANSAFVLENNVAGVGTDPKRDARTDTSTLQPFITWPYTEILGVVNCFMLEGQPDNYNQVFNTQRWALMKQQIDAKLAAGGGALDFAAVQAVMTSYWKAKPRDFDYGDIYNTWTYQMMTYVPATRRFEVFFKPIDDSTPTPPVFHSMTLD